MSRPSWEGRMEAQLERMEALLARLEAVAQALALPPAGAASSAPVDPEEAKAIDAFIERHKWQGESPPIAD